MYFEVILSLVACRQRDSIGDKTDRHIMIIYIDIFGNEKREIKDLKNFKK